MADLVTQTLIRKLLKSSDCMLLLQFSSIYCTWEFDESATKMLRFAARRSCKSFSLPAVTSEQEAPVPLR